MLKAIIMDMDGTILDSEPIHTKAFQGYLDELGVCGVLDEEKDIVGLDLETICRNCIAKFGIDMPEEEYLQGQHDYTYKLFSEETLQETPGLTQFLKDIKDSGTKVAVASATQGDIVRLILKRLGVEDYIDAVCGVETVDNAKPAPDIFIEASNRLGVKREDCAVVEDSAAGIKAAKTAGMKCVAVSCNTGVHEETYKADLVVNDFRDIGYKEIAELVY